MTRGGKGEEARVTAPGIILALLLFAPAAHAQTHMHMPMPEEGVLGIPEERAGSGTSWLPDVAPMHAAHYRAGAWSLMLHGAAFLQYDNQGGPRGADQAALLDWGMLAAARPLGAGRLGLRAMLGTEPWTVGARGYALHRFGASALHSRPLGSRGRWSTALIYGANVTVGSGQTLGSVLLETSVDLDGVNALFARAEYVRKRAEDLAVPAVPADVTYDVGAVSAGYVRELARARGASLAVGVRGAVSLVPASLETLYSSGAPLGAVVYLRLRLLSR